MNIETTADGSPTLYVPELDEHYHSTKGALTESRHIFIEMGLRQSTAPCSHVLEVGFGTGLNAFLTLLDADKSRRPVCYTGIELHPVQTTTLRALDYPALICPGRTDDFYRLHEAPWETDVALTPHFTLRKVQADFTTWTPDETYDVVYFDAFAPRKTTFHVGRTALRPPVCQSLRRRYPHDLLRQRHRAPHAPGSRFPRGTPARPSGRQTRDFAGCESGVKYQNLASNAPGNRRNLFTDTTRTVPSL